MINLQIIVQGKILPTKEIEWVAIRWKAWQIFLCWVIPDEKWGEKVVVDDVNYPQTDLILKAVQTHCAQNLRKLSVPKNYFCIEIPSNLMEKILNEKVK